MNKNDIGKSKARKAHSSNGNSFYRALLFSFFLTILLWIAVSAVLALAVSASSDAGSLVTFVSPVTVVVSLAAGGFAAGKIDKTGGLVVALLLGTACLGVCYALSTVLELTRQMSVGIKTVYIFMMLLCPVLGAKIATNKKKTQGRTKRNKRM